MNILYNILFIISIIGILIGCSVGDDADGCCGAPGVDWMDVVGIPSIILFMIIFFSHWYFGIKLLGMF